MEGMGAPGSSTQPCAWECSQQQTSVPSKPSGAPGQCCHVLRSRDGTKGLCQWDSKICPEGLKKPSMFPHHPSRLAPCGAPRYALPPGGSVCLLHTASPRDSERNVEPWPAPGKSPSQWGPPPKSLGDDQHLRSQTLRRPKKGPQHLGARSVASTVPSSPPPKMHGLPQMPKPGKCLGTASQTPTRGLWTGTALPLMLWASPYNTGGL